MTVRSRSLIGVLCTLAILLAIAPFTADAATVDCGRVTTFVAPNSAGALNNGDGWLIFAKPDGTSEKVILRSGSLTSFGGISGYICASSDGLYFTGLLAPGTPGYIAEPANWVTGTGVYCGIVAAGPFSTGQLSGPRTFQLQGELRLFSDGIFTVPASLPLPAIGAYLCGRFEVGGPSLLVTVLRPGDPGYVAAGLPNTGTAATDPWRSVGLASLIVGLWLTLFKQRSRRDPFAS